MKKDGRKDIRGNEQVSMYTHEGRGLSKKTLHSCENVEVGDSLHNIIHKPPIYHYISVWTSVLLLIFITIQQTLTKERPSNKISKRQLKLARRISIVG